MPRPPRTRDASKGEKATDLTYIHLKIPFFLKDRAIKKAVDMGMDLTEYVRSLLRADLGSSK